MKTIKEFFLRHYYSLWLSPSLSPPSHMDLNYLVFNSGSSKRRQSQMMNSNAVKNHGNSDVATKRRKINEEEGRGESSSIFSFVCEICIDIKTEAENFSITGCSHSYCMDYVVKYVGSRLDDNVINIRCPVPWCGGFLEPEGCREVLPRMVLDRWEKSLCEAAVVENESERFMYCPFKDCSALMIVDDDSLTESKCPSCNRQICVTCEAVWHHGMMCEEFGRTENEDRVVMEVAARNRWKRCPNCRFFVEKKHFTCGKIRCKCGYSFCYHCGKSWDSCYRSIFWALADGTVNVFKVTPPKPKKKKVTSHKRE
ncbi:probable E3 ubiquitin-protein ligase ARI10 [Arachis ipaensis]|uniref:probable E3 ubiquitin-protein ligase ARI10 n=1 Tax=Arachis ipaensis TaxID=130454 RepID=UPI0007AF4047|nr:probable E3 ubiquitin-protein ligase ARI10 [Arachis ipaensis]XP_025673329.1 probable E3 ubiquitin-protein ligase ARI10 [Arachis hypogaea]